MESQEHPEQLVQRVQMEDQGKEVQRDHQDQEVLMALAEIPGQMAHQESTELKEAQEILEHPEKQEHPDYLGQSV